jgi:putative metallohydrolase (TIGR04338 family)
MPDSQRSRVYQAERALDRPEWNRRLGTVQEIQDYVDRIVRSRWFRGAFPDFPGRIIVKDGRGRRRAGGWRTWDGGCITLPVWSRRASIVLHEVAHVVTPRRDAQGRRTAAHGREFAAAFLALVRRWMGAEAAAALRAAFRLHGVRYRPRRAPDPAQRAALAARMAALRQRAVPAAAKTEPEVRC